MHLGRFIFYRSKDRKGRERKGGVCVCVGGSRVEKSIQEDQSSIKGSISQAVVAVN